jgi:hypothetical protein
MTEGLRRYRKQEILSDEPCRVDLFPVEKGHIKFVASQLVLPLHALPKRVTVSYLKTLAYREGKQLKAPTAVELEVRGNLPPHPDPCRSPAEMKHGLSRPEKMNPFPRGIQKILPTAKVEVQTLCRDLGDVNDHPTSPYKSWRIILRGPRDVKQKPDQLTDKPATEQHSTQRLPLRRACLAAGTIRPSVIKSLNLCEEKGYLNRGRLC